MNSMKTELKALSFDEEKNKYTGTFLVSGIDKTLHRTALDKADFIKKETGRIISSCPNGDETKLIVIETYDPWFLNDFPTLKSFAKKEELPKRLDPKEVEIENDIRILEDEADFLLRWIPKTCEIMKKKSSVDIENTTDVLILNDLFFKNKAVLTTLPRRSKASEELVQEQRRIIAQAKQIKKTLHKE